MVLKLEHSGKYFRSNLKVLKSGGGQGGRTDHVKNYESLQRVKEVRNILDTIKRRNSNRIRHSLRMNYLLIHIIQGKKKTMGRGGRRYKQLLENLKETRRYCKLKRNH
jgi:hypothetical protein